MAAGRSQQQKLKLANQQASFSNNVDNMIKHFKAFTFFLKLLFVKASIVAESEGNLTNTVKCYRRWIAEIRQNKKFVLVNFMFVMDQRSWNSSRATILKDNSSPNSVFYVLVCKGSKFATVIS